MYTGAQVLEPRVFDYMARGSVFSMTRETYPRMLAAGEPIFAYPFSGTWLTVGTPDELAAAERALRNSPARLPGTR
jgi:NDP-sugar pyrophosphorylase family protein